MNDKQARRRAAKRANRGPHPRIIRDHKAKTITLMQRGVTLAGPLAYVPDSFIGSGWTPDIDHSGAVDVTDLLWCVTNWGGDDGHGGTVGIAHLLAIITAWEVDTPPTGELDLVQPMVDLPAMNLIRQGIHSEGNCITRNNGGTCTIRVDHGECVSQSGYGVYADGSSFTRFDHARIESKNYYCLRGSHRRLESNDSTFVSPHHSFRIYNWIQGYSLRDTFNVEYLRLGGGGANEWVDPINTGGTPELPIRFEGGHIAATAQVTFYSATHDFEFIDVDFAGTRKLFIDSGAKGLKFIRPKNMPPVDTKGATPSQLAARNIVGI